LIEDIRIVEGGSNCLKYYGYVVRALLFDRFYQEFGKTIYGGRRPALGVNFIAIDMIGIEKAGVSVDKIEGFSIHERDCFVASLLAMTTYLRNRRDL